MAGSKFTVSSALPDLSINGRYQRFTHNAFNPISKFQIFSRFVPTPISDSIINIESRNNQYSGFRWNHTSTTGDANPYGEFSFQSFIGDGYGVNIFGFDGSDLNVYVPSNFNNNRIKNVADPVDGTDAANKDYVLSMSGGSGGTVTLTGNVTGSGTVGTPFATTIQTTLNNIPLATGNVNINNRNLINVNRLGVGVSSPGYQIELPADLERMKVCLYSIGGEYQSYGFGIQPGAIIYNVYNSAASHIFNCGASSSAATELFKIAGQGYASVASGSGTLYSRTPSAQVQMATNVTLTSCTANTLVKIAGTTTASGNEVQFTTSNNRITFTGSHLGTACVGMASASITFYCTAANQTFGICIVKNGSTQLFPFQYNTGVYSGTGYPVNISIPGILTSLSPSNYLEVWLVCSSSTNIRVNALTLSFHAC